MKPNQLLKFALSMLAVSVLLLVAAPSLRANNLAYMGTGGGDFGIINLDTGSFSLRGNSGQALAGMAVLNGTLYGSSVHTTGTLYSVNPANGVLTVIGPSALVYDDFGSTINGLYAVVPTQIFIPSIPPLAPQR